MKKERNLDFGRFEWNVRFSIPEKKKKNFKRRENMSLEFEEFGNSQNTD